MSGDQFHRVAVVVSCCCVCSVVQTLLPRIYVCGNMAGYCVISDILRWTPIMVVAEAPIHGLWLDHHLDISMDACMITLSFFLDNVSQMFWVFLFLSSFHASIYLPQCRWIMKPSKERWAKERQDCLCWFTSDVYRLKYSNMIPCQEQSSSRWR